MIGPALPCAIANGFGQKGTTYSYLFKSHIRKPGAPAGRSFEWLAPSGAPNDVMVASNLLRSTSIRCGKPWLRLPPCYQPRQDG